jgi:hypothetical protein
VKGQVATVRGLRGGGKKLAAGCAASVLRRAAVGSLTTLMPVGATPSQEAFVMFLVGLLLLHISACYISCTGMVLYGSCDDDIDGCRKPS